MTNLVAIVRATRKSAKALDRMQEAYRAARDWAPPEVTRKRIARYRRARAAYEAAQRVLAANPLPGDRQ